MSTMVQATKEESPWLLSKWAKFYGDTKLRVYDEGIE